MTHQAMQRIACAAMAALLGLVSSSCGEYVRSQGNSPVMLVINSLQGARGSEPDNFGNPVIADVITNITTPDPCTTNSPCPTIFGDLGQAELQLVFKDQGQPGITQPSTPINSVTLTRYRVEYSRTDGRTTPGVDVPYPIDAAMTFTIPPPGATATVGFQLVKNTAKSEPPLRDLVSSGVIINMNATVTFYGHDLAGNEVTARGGLTVTFGNFNP